MLDKRGKLFGYFNQIRGSDPLIRQRQYDCFKDEVKADHLRKWLIRQELESWQFIQNSNPCHYYLFKSLLRECTTFG